MEEKNVAVFLHFFRSSRKLFFIGCLYQSHAKSWKGVISHNDNLVLLGLPEHMVWK